jgi:hypothetical protein
VTSCPMFNSSSGLLEFTLFMLGSVCPNSE